MEPSTEKFTLRHAFAFVGRDVVRRLWRLFFASRSLPVGAALSLVPGAAADYDPDRLLPNETFFPRPASTNFTFADVQAESGNLDFSAWQNRGWLIRSGHNNTECAGNLSLALQSLGTLNMTEYQGASGALSLLPTAGALFG